MDNKIYISQMLKTIQGEGGTVGTPVMLVRFTGCNLKCPWCDTWDLVKSKKGYLTIKYERPYIIIDDREIDLLEESPDTIMFTGGEPSLYFNDDVFKKTITTLIANQKNVEIESNLFDFDGVINFLIFLNTFFIKNINTDKIAKTFGKTTFNFSPKLEEKCYKMKLEFLNFTDKFKQIGIVIYKLINVISRILNARFKQVSPDHYLVNCTFKFVYDKEIDEILQEKIEDLKKIGFDKNSIFLMPKTPKFDENFDENWAKSQKETIKKCFEFNVRFSPRLHINIFGDDIYEKTD